MTSASLDRRDDLVTGEAVLLDLRPASFAVRAVSFVIDAVIGLATLIGGAWGLSQVAAAVELDAGYLAAGYLLISVLALVGIPVVSEMLTNGRSLGRWAMGTRVVRDDGGAVHSRQSLLRALTAMLEIWTTSGMIALVISLIDRRSRRLGDLLAGTYVVQERLRARPAARVDMPSHLAAWASSADVARIPSALLLELRTFLVRAATLHERSRRDLALDLVQRVVPSVSPPPPPGTDPIAFLTAVLAERSRRDEALLCERRDREDQLAYQVATLPFTD